MEKSINIAIIGGVRPQFIKMAAMDWAIKKYNILSNIKFSTQFINTGQHYDESLSTDISEELNLHFDFNIKYSDKDPINIMGNMFIELSKILDLIQPKPTWVIVMGDATTTFVGAVIAARKGYPVIHVEAGVRSGSLSSVEEMHRRIVSHIATVHFCTSKTGVHNLNLENITKNVYWTGDIAHDFIVDCASNDSETIEKTNNDYILVTLHKPINVESPDIITNLITILANYPRQSIFVVHPRTKKIISKLGINDQIGNLKLIDALPYAKMLSTVKRCSYMITDSGGLQREAYYLKKRCLVRRDAVGWTNFIEAGIHYLISGDQENIKSGLEWAENTILNPYPNIDDEFIRQDAWKYALDTIVDLSGGIKE